MLLNIILLVPIDGFSVHHRCGLTRSGTASVERYEPHMIARQMICVLNVHSHIIAIRSFSKLENNFNVIIRI